MNIEQERAFEQILHSVQQAQIPGNDWRREMKIIESTCRAALQPQDREDAERFRWLTEDHTDEETRTRCREILDRMAVMSYSAACVAIDHARRIERDGE